MRLLLLSAALGFFGWNYFSRVFILPRENPIQKPPVKVKEYPLHEIKLSFTSSDVGDAVHLSPLKMSTTAISYFINV